MTYFYAYLFAALGVLSILITFKLFCTFSFILYDLADLMAAILYHLNKLLHLHVKHITFIAWTSECFGVLWHFCFSDIVLVFTLYFEDQIQVLFILLCCLFCIQNQRKKSSIHRFIILLCFIHLVFWPEETWNKIYYRFLCSCSFLHIWEDLKSTNSILHHLCRLKAFSHYSKQFLSMLTLCFLSIPVWLAGLYAIFGSHAWQLLTFPFQWGTCWFLQRFRGSCLSILNH